MCLAEWWLGAAPALKNLRKGGPTKKKVLSFPKLNLDCRWVGIESQRHLILAKETNGILRVIDLENHLSKEVIQNISSFILSFPIILFVDLPLMLWLVGRPGASRSIPHCIGESCPDLWGRAQLKSLTFLGVRGCVKSEKPLFVMLLTHVVYPSTII